MENTNRLLQIEELKVYFPITKGIIYQRHVGDVKAVDGISFFIKRGETLGLVGESGCGKSTTGRAILQILSPTSGKVVFKGQDLSLLPDKAIRNKRKKMQMIFQDPYASLNPRMSVNEIVSEPMLVHEQFDKKIRNKKAKELMKIVGLNPNFVNRYPHEFSGGQRQRIGIARAISLNPEFIICDEPTSALDVSIQAQIINLLIDLQKKLELTYLFISHDLNVVRHISDRIAVMYLGKLFELADRSELFKHPIHPYTKALLSAVPIPNPAKEKTREPIILKGDIPSPSKKPKGCGFNTRCPQVKDVCSEIDPEFREVRTNHWLACHQHVTIN